MCRKFPKHTLEVVSFSALNLKLQSIDSACVSLGGLWDQLGPYLVFRPSQMHSYKSGEVKWLNCRGKEPRNFTNGSKSQLTNNKNYALLQIAESTDTYIFLKAMENSQKNHMGRIRSRETISDAVLLKF